VDPEPALEGEARADIAVVGGGYTGMWAAWFAKRLEPEAEVALVEEGVCGRGPSGRNGGFVNQMWFSLPTLRHRFGDEAALAVARAAQDAVAGVGRFCEEQGVDAWYRHGGYLQVSTTPLHDAVWEKVLASCRELGATDVCVPQTADQVAGRCTSPLFRAGAFYPGAATVQPARLAHGLRDALVAAGVRIHESSPVLKLARTPGGFALETERGRLRAGAGVLAAGPSVARLAPLPRRLTLTSSHMVITEPVPDVLEQIGWTGGECITDSRAMLHYFRTTPDGRIAFGWGGGRIVAGTRVRERISVDARLVEQVAAHLRRFFPQLEGRHIEHAWGGPIDVSPSHMPVISSLPHSRAFAGFGYTGNGVGPSHMVGRALASLALDRRDEHSRLAIVDPPPVRVPPEPFRWVGGTIIRRALLRKENAEEAGQQPDPLTRFVAGIPERIGIHVGR